ncbi:MAG: hypothetical protein KZQ64_00605 [gamma proteobacterium symbiont of Bathyaustriella thionipta]|nr:hypothetical protein [gamma proteobacterium symbiont of Bathyaustriella thionipta]MCU7950832.1 hypothetical protein [gamma proteobacterium symbiont of Bathyaustriella thionipta]MCU7951908.1 hypothetical protein [gamma proteobacterium symbiont of Bathyaustriella thionipta]MCU7957348.1 hypothetical protein [gamma proteobacterium symbiont of Bathyaustriella thionipta]MCU7966657.1 hypothetical protein [gamma proteobacterium symbiont of Bathyaustriella thionipta]
MISRELIHVIRETFQLNWQGVHGVSHWARVRINGLLIARQNGANQRIVELFAFLHDSQREADFNDPFHGERAAEFIQSLPNELLIINDQEKELLMLACADHSKGFVDGDVTIRTCWDADRLDLGRGGQRPNINKLCTDISKQADFFEQAYQRATYQHRIQASTATVQTWKPVQ